MSHVWSCHLGRRAEEWPPELSRHPSRAAARSACATALRVSPPTQDKAEVRCDGMLMDSYSRDPGGRIRHVYAQPPAETVQRRLPL